MTDFFAKTPLDAAIFEQEIRPWLPPVVFDAHVHVSLKEHCGPVSAERFKQIWAMEVGIDQSWECLRANYATLFPGIEVQSLVFGGVYYELDISKENAYVLRGALDPANQSLALYVIKPDESPGAIQKAISDGFIGIKPYPDLSPSGIEDCSVFDFLPHEHLRVLNQLKGVLMLHISRPGRIADADNVREILDINDRYPDIRIILAHVGRAFCLPTAEKGLPQLADRPGILTDISANLNADVFAFAIETLGVDRILFGSDLPITMMRGVREHVGEKYINYTDQPYSWNTNRKPPEEESTYTFYLYEELRALISAAKQTCIGVAGVHKIMNENAQALLKR